jgi:hypothetical protein
LEQLYDTLKNIVEFDDAVIAQASGAQPNSFHNPPSPAPNGAAADSLCGGAAAVNDVPAVATSDLSQGRISPWSAP